MEDCNALSLDFDIQCEQLSVLSYRELKLE